MFELIPFLFLQSQERKQLIDTIKQEVHRAAAHKVYKPAHWADSNVNSSLVFYVFHEIRSFWLNLSTAIKPDLPIYVVSDLNYTKALIEDSLLALEQATVNSMVEAGQDITL